MGLPQRLGKTSANFLPQNISAVVRTQMPVKSVFFQSADYRIDIHVSLCGLMTVLIKIGIVHELQLTKMSEIYAFCVLSRHFRQVVKSARP